MDRLGHEKISLNEFLWEDAESIRMALEQAENLDEARESLLAVLYDIENDAQCEDLDENRLEWSARLQAIQTLKGFLSPENEAVAGMSTLQVLWDLATETKQMEAVPGFIDELWHLFKAMRGESGIGRGWLAKDPDLAEHYFDDLPQAGRRAATRRSRYLDEVAERVNQRIDKYPCGLDEPLVKARETNRGRIREYFGASLQDWSDWQWQARNVLKGLDGFDALRELVPLRIEEATAVHEAVRSGIPWGITPYYLSLFDFDSSSRESDDQVRSQVMPPLHLVRSMIEHQIDRGTALDFMCEHDTSPIDRITRRYPHVAILKVCGTCPQICTYCQRNWEIDDAMMWERMPTEQDLDPALDWFAQHPAISDVLVTGGDPLILPDSTLFYVLDRIAHMPHIRHVRIGTRVPVTLPMRVTPEFVDRLASYVRPGERNLSVVTHVESGCEITPELAHAVTRLKSRGISVFNQLVFTLQTSRRFQNAATRIALNRVGITPYYTFYPKGKAEHRDYLVPIARILQERKEEARLLPGIFRTDEPVFNVPRLGKHHLRARQDREWIGVRPDGRRIYLIHPWEKGIAPVSPWPYVDVSIRDYLQRMEALGEEIDEYASIWYYS